MDVLFKHFEEAKVCDLTSGFTYAYNSWQYQYAENEPPSYSTLLTEQNTSTPIGLKNGDHLHLNQHVQSGLSIKIVQLYQDFSVTDHNEDEDELEKFLNGAPTPIFSTPLQWWTRDEQRAQYPRLYQMAINILSIPPLSDKIEGVFSGVRRAIPWERGSLHMETVQIQELIGNWNKNGLLHEDEYVNELLMEAAAVVEKAEKRQDSEMGGGDEDELYSLL